MLEKRTSGRSKMVLAVKISLDATSDLVHTVDIADDGAQLGGLRIRLQPGAIIGLQRGRKKAKFRIAWIRQLASNELRAGIECLQPQKDFWGIQVSNRKSGCNNYTNAIMTLLTASSR